MAYLKGVDLSGSSDISGSIAVFEQITGSFITGSFTGNVIGTTSTASYVDFGNIDNKPTLLSSSAQIASDISGAFTADSASIASDIAGLVTDSGSFSTRVTDLETFSSSLDATFATEAELNAATSSLSASLATDIATKANSASFASDIATLDSTTVKLTGNQTISGIKTFSDNIIVQGTASINHLETIYETASIIYSSGSTKFGDTLDDTHIFTGSLLVTGSSYTINGENIIITSALNAATSSLSSSLATSITTNSSSAATDIAALVVDSGSFSTRVTDLETFSSSLDDTFATEAELNAATASLSSSLAIDIATKANSASFATDIASLVTDSGSFSTRVTDLETFSSSLDDTFATEAELNTATASLSSSLAVDIATKANSASFATDIASLVTDSGSFSTRVTDLETFSSSLDDTFATEAELNTATASLSSSLAVDIATNTSGISTLTSKTGSYATTGSNIFVGNQTVTGSVDVSGSVTAYGFNIDSNATGTPALYSSTNLNLSASNAVVVTSSPLRVASLTNAETGSFTGQDGDIIFNSTRAAYMVYSGSDWREVIIEGFTASYASQALSSSYALTASNAISSSYSLTASYAENAGSGTGFPFSGSAVITGSLELISGSYIGDGSGLTNISISQATTVTASFTNSVSETITHNFDSKNVIISVYNASDSQIMPETVTLTDNNTATITFAATSSGYIVVAKGGHLVPILSTASLAYTASFITGSGVYGPFGSNSIISASYALTASYVETAQTASYVTLAQTASYVTTAQTASYVTAADVEGIITSASYAITASYAENAGGGGVTSITAGPGITIDQSTGDVTISTDTVVGGTIITSSFTSTTSTTITHNFNSKNVIISVYDNSDNEIIPSSVQLISDNAATATFASAQSGYIVAIEAQSGEYASTEFTSTGSVTLNHTLGTQDLNVVTYDSSDVQIIPDITILDSSNVKATFASPSSGRLLAIAREGSVSASFSNTTDTTITHNLSSSAIIASVYDTSYNEIIPDSISIVDTSSINITFATSTSGNVVVMGGPINSTTVTTATSYDQAITGSSSYTITHNLGTEWPLVQVYESSSRAQHVPQSIVSVDASNITLTFSTTFDGHVIINS